MNQRGDSVEFLSIEAVNGDIYNQHTFTIVMDVGRIDRPGEVRICPETA